MEREQGLRRTPVSGKSAGLSAAVGAVLVAQLFCLWGFWHTIDLQPADESVHLHNGIKILRGEVDPARFFVWGGTYEVFLGTLARAFRADRVQDVSLALCALASTLLLLWALAARSVVGAAFLACCWATAGAYLVLHRAEYLFGAAWAFLAVGLLVRGRRATGVLAFVVAALVRPEAQAWMLGVGLLYAMRRGTRGAGASMVLAALALAAVQAGSSPGRERAWMGFKQHYAGERARLNTDGGEDKTRSPDWQFNHPDEAVHADFGDARSLAGALLVAPAKFLGHVGRNVLALPGGIVSVIAPFPGTSGIGQALGWLLLALAIVGALRTARSRTPARFLPFLLASPLLFSSSILFRPSPAFLVAAVLPMGMLVLEALEPFLARLRTAGARRACVLSAAALAVCVPRPLDATPRRSLPWRELVAAAWEWQPATLYYPRPFYGIAALLPPGTRCLVESEAAPPGTLAFLHAEDLMLGNAGVLVPDEQYAFDDLFASDAWSVVGESPSVLVLEARP